MKNIVMVIAAVSFMMSVSSCKKCQTCTVADGAAVFSTTNKCGSKSDLEEQTKICQTATKTFAGSKCNCTED